MPHTVTLSHSALVQEEFLHHDNPVLWCDLTNPISPFDYKPERNKKSSHSHFGTICSDCLSCGFFHSLCCHCWTGSVGSVANRIKSYVFAAMLSSTSKNKAGGRTAMTRVRCHLLLGGPVFTVPPFPSSTRVSMETERCRGGAQTSTGGGYITQSRKCQSCFCCTLLTREENKPCGPY